MEEQVLRAKTTDDELMAGIIGDQDEVEVEIRRATQEDGERDLLIEEMIETQDFREPRLELPLIVQFLPALMSLIVDDQVGCTVRS